MSSLPINSIDFFKSDILNIFFLNEGWLFNVSVINPEWGTKSLFSDITTNLLVQHGYILSDGSYDISNIVHLLNQALELMKRLTNNLTQINEWFYQGTILSAKKELFTIWIEMNEFNRFTILLPEDH